jgi:exopolyphosphatase/guanosine-5'-triphosphate,3'-diphosphate pyrophosphatase
MAIAAIDIGSNSILLLVAEHRPEGLLPLIDLAQTVRLGEGVAATGKLSDAAMARTLAGLAAYAVRLQAFSISRVVCFGTAALRRAGNAAGFIEQVQQRFGWEVQVLSGDDEARYTFQGILSALPVGTARAVAIDIGGGSTEVIYGTPTAITYQQSFPVGAVSLKEQFDLTDPISATQQQAIQTRLAASFASLPAPLSAPCLVTGGTATTLAALALQLTCYDIQRIEGYAMGRTDIAELYDTLNALTQAERSRLPGMEAGRADIILPALLILLTLMERLQAKRVQVTVRGVRYGVLLG